MEVLYESGFGNKVGTMTMLYPNAKPSVWELTDQPRHVGDTSSHAIKIDENDCFSLWSIGHCSLGVSEKGVNDLYLIPALISLKPSNPLQVKLGKPLVDVVDFQLETTDYISDLRIDNRVIDILKNDIGFFISIGFESNEDFLSWKLKQ